MAHLVDSSVFVALFADEDVCHARAVAAVRRITGKIIVPYCVVNETATVLTYKHSRAHAESFLTFLDDNHDVIMLDDVLQEEVSWYRSIDTRVSFTDAALVFLSLRHRATLVTFDKQLARLAKKQLKGGCAKGRG